MVQSSSLIAVLTAAALFLSMACGSEVILPSSQGAAGGSGGGSGGGTTSSTNPCYPDSCSGPTSAVTTGVGGSETKACGVAGGTACPSDSFCSFGHKDCGQTPEPIAPSCVPAATACKQPSGPTCGCDGQVYPSECDAALAGVSGGGQCKAPAGMFQCGPGFCSTGSEYCLIQAEYATSGYQCVPTPATCAGSASCNCVEQPPCMNQPSCNQPPDGGVSWFCYSG